MTQAEHTPELKPCPWCKAEGEHRLFHNDEGIDDVFHANACVNACAGLNPEAIQAAIEALEKIIKGEGRFSRDPLEHADSCIEDMKALAVAALAAVKEVPSDVS